MAAGALILKNVSREGPGLIAEVLRASGIPFDAVDLDRGEPIPALDEYDLLIVLGGPDSANDDSPKIKNELGHIRRWLGTGKPYLGVCLGLQLMVKAAGGRVLKSPVKETGFLDPEGNRYRVDLTEEGRKDPLFEGLGGSFPVFQLHGERVEVPPGAALLATGKFCREQIVRLHAKAYGIQCHFEVTGDLLRLWQQEDPDLQKETREVLCGQWQRLEKEYTLDGEKLFSNFLKLSGLLRGMYEPR